MDYKYNKATPAAIGLYLGLMPHKIKEFTYLTSFQKIFIQLNFHLISLIVFLLPSILFFKLKGPLYRWVKKVF